MGLLNRFFGSTESTTKEIEADDESVIKHWKHYLSTISRKKELIERLREDNNFKSNLQKLKKLLDLELVDISDEEKEESELLSDLEAIEHDKKIKRVHRLEQCLGYAETKYEYVYGLLQHLHSILKSQMHLVVKLQAGSKDTERLISHIKLQLGLELEILNKINEIKTFHGLFLALIKEEHIIHTMDAKEKKLLKKIQKGINKIFANEVPEGEQYITYEWAMAVFNAIEDKVHEAVANGMFPGYHPDIDFEFVNRPEFVDLVRVTIYALKGPHQEPHIVAGKILTDKVLELKQRKVSEQMINVFVHLFREWYNHERD